MQRISNETRDALKAGRVAWFVCFDFLFSPMRVHSGESPIHWEGHEWEGLGEVVSKGLKTAPIGKSFSALCTLRSEQKNEKKLFAASLPVIPQTREVIHKERYYDRKMEMFLCAVDERGQVIERLWRNSGVIVEYTRKEDALTFGAHDPSLDSTEMKDSRRRQASEEAQQQFNQAVQSHFRSDAISTAIAGGAALLTGIAGEAAGFWNQFVSPILVFAAMFGALHRKTIRQRWRARKRAFWFQTEPRIPGLGFAMSRRKRGYKVRAHTQKEARAKLYGKLLDKKWQLPEGFRCYIVYVDGAPPEILNLEKACKEENPRRWAKIDPIRKWGVGD